MKKHVFTAVAVALVGDSICNGYQAGVRELLKGKMNVSYWISSYCVTSAA